MNRYIKYKKTNHKENNNMCGMPLICQAEFTSCMWAQDGKWLQGRLLRWD